MFILDMVEMKGISFIHKSYYIMTKRIQLEL